MIFMGKLMVSGEDFPILQPFLHLRLEGGRVQSMAGAAVAAMVPTVPGVQGTIDDDHDEEKDLGMPMTW